jgi:hypothetical protein
MDPDKTAPGSKYSQHFAIFKEGCSKKLIKWLMDFHKIENLMPMKEPSDKTRMFRILLKGHALSYFESHLRRSLEAE